MKKIIMILIVLLFIGLVRSQTLYDSYVIQIVSADLPENKTVLEVADLCITIAQNQFIGSGDNETGLISVITVDPYTHKISFEISGKRQVGDYLNDSTITSWLENTLGLQNTIINCMSKHWYEW